MIEYDCEGCGVHVFGFGRDTVPKSHMWQVYQNMNRDRSLDP